MYFLKRLVFTIPLILVISFLAFGLMHLAPGGPFDKERAPASPEIKRALEAKFHLNEPVWKQYLRYLGLLWDRTPEGNWHRVDGGLIAGDFGPSMRYRNHSVNDIIAQGLPASLTLGALSFCFALGFGLPLGFVTAVRKGNWQEYAGSFLALLVICVPALVIGGLFQLPQLPIGPGKDRREMGNIERVRVVFRHKGLEPPANSIGFTVPRNAFLWNRGSAMSPREFSSAGQ